MAVLGYTNEEEKFDAITGSSVYGQLSVGPVGGGISRDIDPKSGEFEGYTTIGGSVGLRSSVFTGAAGSFGGALTVPIAAWKYKNGNHEFINFFNFQEKTKQKAANNQ